MIIQWNYTENLDAVLESQTLLEVLHELLRAHRLGHHLVIFDRKVCALLSNLSLNSQEQATLRRLRSDFSQTGNLPRSASHFVSILNTTDQHVSRSGPEIKISIGTAKDSQIFGKSALVVENQESDGKIIERILLDTMNKKTGNAALEIIHGGGASTHTVAKANATNKRLVFVIIDGDTNAPSTTIPPKLLQVRAALSEASWPATEAVALPCREVENLVPPEVLFSIEKYNGNATTTSLKKIMEFESQNSISDSESLFIYFDMKKGINNTTLSNMSEGDRNWVVDRIRGAGIKISDNTLKGYGCNLMKYINEDSDKMGAISSIITNGNWHSRLRDFFESVGWFFAAPRKLIT